MSLGWDARGDFAAVVDTLEPVSLVRRGCDALPESLQAWRFHESIAGLANTDGEVVEGVAVWQLPDEPGATPPKPGDLLIDGTRRCWSIESVERRCGQTRFDCRTRLIVFAHDADRFDVLRSEGAGSASNARLIRAAVRGKLIDVAGGRRVLLEGRPDVLVGDTLRSHRTGAFKADRVQGPVHPGHLTVVDVTQEVATAGA